MSVLGLIVAMLLGAAVFGLVIYIVGKLGLGIEVSGFGAAFVAAIVIAVLSWLVTWILQALGFAFGGALCGPLVTLLISAAVLLLAGRWVKGLTVKGYGGAIIAAIAMAVVAWLLNWVVGLFL